MSAKATESERVVAVDDYYLLDETLSEDECELRDRVREFCDRAVLPVINDYWERAEFPFELVPKLAELNVAGTTIEGYGCPDMSRLGAGVVARELARADGSRPSSTTRAKRSWCAQRRATSLAATVC